MACNKPTSINAASIHFLSVFGCNMHKIARVVEPTSREKSLWDKIPPSQHFYYTPETFLGDKTSYFLHSNDKI